MAAAPSALPKWAAAAAAICGTARAAPPGRAGYQRLTISSRWAEVPGTQGSVRERSTRWSATVPTANGPVGRGSTAFGSSAFGGTDFGSEVRRAGPAAAAAGDGRAFVASNAEAASPVTST